MITILILLLAAISGIILYTKQAKFGRMPAGKAAARIKQSLHYNNGKFQNIHDTPDLTDGATYYSVLKEQFFGKDKRNYPKVAFPSQKTDLHKLAAEENVLIWFGHSSYFIQADGKRFLIDPVFSGNASPIPGTVKSFKGTNQYQAADMPEIDYLFISHDHWDHLDYDTVIKLRPKIKKIITGLGTAAHLESWGFEPAIIEEKDWNETLYPEDGLVIHTISARHFSGRGLKRQTSLWMSFILQTPSFKLFLGGDSGYDTHFAEAGNAFGPFDLAILECGQYNKSWKYIHMMPEEVVKAAQDLKATRAMPVHWGKFSLSFHAWDDPITRVTKAARENGLPLLTPMIGEKINLDDESYLGSEWWKGMA